jgi:hypothetical protein
MRMPRLETRLANWWLPARKISNGNDNNSRTPFIVLLTQELMNLQPAWFA